MNAKSSPADLRRRNRDLVLQHLVRHGAISRTHLTKLTGLTGAAISRITRELIDVGLIQEGKRLKLQGRVGRRNVELELCGNGAFVLGLGITFNTRHVAIADARGNILAQRDIDQLDLASPQQALARIAAVTGKLIEESGVDRSRLLGGGISIAGRTDEKTGALTGPNLLGWGGISVGEILQDRIGIPFAIEGRAVALLLAEMRRGQAVGLNNVVLINMSLGCGGAVILDGRLVRGRGNAVGHIAHFAIPGDETPCSCGAKGCVDATASGFSILSRLHSVRKPRGMAKPVGADDYGARLSMLAQWAGDDHVAAGKAFFDAGAKLGYAVNAMQSILDPELIMLAGVAGRQPRYLAGVDATLSRLRGKDHGVPLATSKINTAESAIWLALDAFVYSRQLDIERLKVA